MSKLVLIALADRADDAGKCYPKISTLAEDCECSTRTIERALARLEKVLGVISIERRAIEGMKTSSVYRIDWDTAQSLIVSTESRNATSESRNDATEGRNGESAVVQVATDASESHIDASQSRDDTTESRKVPTESRSRYDTESHKPPIEPPTETPSTDMSSPDGDDAPKAVERIPFQAIVDAYHEILPELRKVKVITRSRQTHIRQRHRSIMENSLELWRQYFAYVRQSEFLMGKVEGKNWVADFDFLITERAATGIYEGKYHGQR